MAVVFALLVVLLVAGSIHGYLWLRLVHDTTTSVRLRWIGAAAAVLLCLLIPATVAGSNAGLYWLAWPGYLWLALMFYLMLVLLALELPALLARLALRRAARRKAGDQASAQVAPAQRAPSAVGPGRPAGPGSATPAALGPPGPLGPPGSLGPPAAAAGEAPDPTDPDHPARRGQPDPADAGTDHDPRRRLLLARSAAIVAGLAAAGITGYGVRVATGPPRLDRVRIGLARLPRRMDGLRIATVSDIHLGPLAGRAHAERIVALINQVDADLVAVVGDLVDGSVAELGPAAEPLRGIRSRYGGYFVTGNHEYYAGVSEWVAEVDRLGLRVLQNARQEIVTPGGVLDLAGVNDVSARGTGVAAGPDFDAALGGRDPSRPVVLLAHQPVAVHEAARRGVDLQLSGHTHGGQVWPFDYVVRLQQPVVSGHATVDGTQLYVTNGAGFWGPPVRVGAPPQVTLVELRST
ncbi:metallophosphoesterase [Plantactinospora sp. KBS50]|uniref:metallophosphoesterase n=1 Tax=Plantactinospora sp. KBS50 TaxID=2024580 RepID=UPI000BAAC6A2|nr:metallophosphoesterase [Plantactinospora sp. KBS50]ASW57272.1 hypothetical protein CIK06_28720 [Plantactinospora sp. KBS50]